MKKLLLALAAGAGLWPALSLGAIPISGKPVPTMAIFDQMMTNYMTTNSIEAGVLGIMRHERIVYLRGFGYLDRVADGATNDIPLPENAIFRQASLSKYPTAAAVRKLAEAGAFGLLGIDRPAFRLTVNGVDNNGILNITPWQSLGDSNWAAVTVRHLLDQTSGYQGSEPHRQIPIDLGIPAPPTRADVIRYKLHERMSNSPAAFPYTNFGSAFSYQNFNYVTLAEIISVNHSGVYINGMRQRVMSPEAWIPASEVIQSATLREGHDPREPWYRTGCLRQTVYDPSPSAPIVSCAYGGEFDMEAFSGAASLAASAQAMLIFGSKYHLNYPNAGVPVTANFPANDGPWDGGLAGISTRLRSRSDGIVIYLAFNKGSTVGPIYNLISTAINDGTGFSWPNSTSDGFWVNLGAPQATPQFGGYQTPCNGWTNALNRVSDGTRLRLKPGNTAWAGRITKRLRLDAPDGIVTIGR